MEEWTAMIKVDLLYSECEKKYENEALKFTKKCIIDRGPIPRSSNKWFSCKTPELVKAQQDIIKNLCKGKDSETVSNFTSASKCILNPNLKSENTQTTCFLSSAIVAFMSFKNTDFINKLLSKENCLSSKKLIPVQDNLFLNKITRSNKSGKSGCGNDKYCLYARKRFDMIDISFRYKFKIEGDKFKIPPKKYLIQKDKLGKFIRVSDKKIRVYMHTCCDIVDGKFSADIVELLLKVQNHLQSGEKKLGHWPWVSLKNIMLACTDFGIPENDVWGSADASVKTLLRIAYGKLYYKRAIFETWLPYDNDITIEDKIMSIFRKNTELHTIVLQVEPVPPDEELKILDIKRKTKPTFLKQSISIDGVTFELLSIIVASEVHYTSFIWNKASWLYFDSAGGVSTEEPTDKKLKSKYMNIYYFNRRG